MNADGLGGRRLKTTHTQGLVAKVHWIPNKATIDELGYTGIYAEGSNTVILRLSESANLNAHSTGLTPSMALKFIVDDYRSSNLFAATSFKESDSWNFFENDMSN